MCASIRCPATHKFWHRHRNFIYVNDWVNFLIFMAFNSTIQTKLSFSCMKKIRVSSVADSMKVFAQTEFRFYHGMCRLDACSFFVRTTLSFRACSCTKVWCYHHLIAALNEAKTNQELASNYVSTNPSAINKSEFCFQVWKALAEALRCWSVQINICWLF